MFKFVNLYSGSTGNSSLIITDKTKVLVDAGESAKKICEGLDSLGYNIEDIDAIVLTHEHVDHSKALPILSRKYDIPVYANKETFNELENVMGKEIKNKKLYIPYKAFNIDDLDILPFNVSHDAANPCGFNFFNSSQKITVATDLGFVDQDVFDHMKNSSFILLESNYDSNTLKDSRYPYYLKRRISSSKGHLSNDQTSDVIYNLINFGLKKIELAHLSKENNFPELAYQTLLDKLIHEQVDLSDITVNVASNYLERKIIDIG